MTPGFIALGAGVGNISTFIFKPENLNDRFHGIEIITVLIGAGENALVASGTVVGVNVE